MSIELPDNLQTVEFRAAWETWCTHRREKRKPLTETSVRLQIKELSEWGPVRGVSAILHSVKKSWEGIFEPAGTTNGKASGNGSTNGHSDPLWQSVVKFCVNIQMDDATYPAKLEKQFGAETAARIRKLKVREIKAAADLKAKGNDFRLRELQKQFSEIGGAA